MNKLTYATKVIVKDTYNKKKRVQFLEQVSGTSTQSPLDEKRHTN